MKSWYKSKTLWLNIIALAISIVEITWQTYPLDPKEQVLILAVLNGILRIFFTNQPIQGGTK